MDIKLSEKTTMYQPNGPVDVLVAGVFDFYLIEKPIDEEHRYPLDLNDGQKWIYDLETLDGTEEEEDRVLFSILRQRGQDPITPGEGIQWAEALMSEIPVPLLMSQITGAASDESSYVNVGFQSIKGQLSIVINSMDVSRIMEGYPNVI